jgi:uncharacterized RDD family membrane protein YckC
VSTANPYAPPRGAVQDFVAGEGLELGGRAARLAAAIVDGIIVCVMTYVPALLVLFSTGALVGPEPQAADSDFLIAGLVFFSGFIAWAWITILLVARFGQTMGKRLLEIRVVRSDGAQASLGRIFLLRNVVNGLLGFIPLYALVDVLFIFSEQRQCIHDRLADTIVVKA